MGHLEREVSSKIQELLDDMLDLQPEIMDVLKNVNMERRGNRIEWGFNQSNSNLFSVLAMYEKWYNSAFPLVVDYLPDRENEFRERYDTIRRGLEIDLDYIREKEIKSVSTLQNNVSKGIIFQHNLISSIPERVESEALKARKEISNNIVSSEIQHAKKLFDDGDIRAAGVIAGVALERHLMTLCESSNQALEFDYMDGIASLATTLSSANEIGDDDQRLAEYLGGIRNKCSHATDEEPKRREVERMLNHADEFIHS